MSNLLHASTAIFLEPWIRISYSPELIYVQGFENIAADAWSRLDIVDTPNPVKNNIKSINTHYGLEDEGISHLTNYNTIMQN